MPDNAAIRLEEERIQSVYSERRSDPRYSWLSAGHLFMMHEQERAVLALLRRAGFDSLDTVRVLEVGCGTGDWLRRFVAWGARPDHLTGVDILPHRLDEAAQRCAPGVQLRVANAADLPEADAAFDIVVQSTLFTSILDDSVKAAAAAEMRRVLKADGLIVWYDYFAPSLRNPHVRPIRKAEIRRLFPQCRIDVRRVTLAPPIARRVAGHSHLLCELLTAMPWLRTHYLAAIRNTASHTA